MYVCMYVYSIYICMYEYMYISNIKLLKSHNKVNIQEVFLI